MGQLLISRATWEAKHAHSPGSIRLNSLTFGSCTCVVFWYKVWSIPLITVLQTGSDQQALMLVTQKALFLFLQFPSSFHMKNLHQDRHGKCHENSTRREIRVMGAGEIKGGKLKRIVHLFKKEMLSWGKWFNLLTQVYEENHVFLNLSSSQCSFNTSCHSENIFIECLFKILYNFNSFLQLIQCPIVL